MKDKDTGRPRGFGFVKYDSIDAVDAVIADYDIHKIQDKWVEVKRTVPEERKKQPLAWQQRGHAPARNSAAKGFAKGSTKGAPQHTGYASRAGPAQSYGHWNQEPPRPSYGRTSVLPSRAGPSAPPRGASDGCKLFVGGLPAEATKDDLDAYFHKYGRIIDSIVMRDRKFGFVTFDNFRSADAVMRDYEHHRIRGFWVEVKRTIPKPGEAPSPTSSGGYALAGRSSHQPYPQAQPSARRPQSYDAYSGAYGPAPRNNNANGGGWRETPQPTARYQPAGRGGPPMPSRGAQAAQPYGSGGRSNAAPTTFKVFIGGLPPCQTQDLIDYFEQYGRIVDAIAMDNRGFGFVKYDNLDSVERVMQDYHQHQILGQHVDVKRAVPETEMKGKGKGSGKQGYGKRSAPY
eukprot:TRINITY_DN5513_c0_g3_i1.p1 TRINITY_DN5513_c0_g3~~TRINITY_DN5513_c0_g3_i1.p1  ORF type:complete len:402 (-),score=54.95 TRINITY_DN5513_c0_g3_i1:46-1251(-)